MSNEPSNQGPEKNAPAAPAAGLYAGLVKAFATKAAITITAALKGYLQWWFRVPLKLFRPHTISPYYMFHAMAKESGTNLSLKYMKTVVSDEGVR
jgi:hypothetical protein